MTRQIRRTGRNLFNLHIESRPSCHHDKADHKDRQNLLHITHSRLHSCILSSPGQDEVVNTSIRWSKCSERPPTVVSRDPFAPIWDRRLHRSIRCSVLRYLEPVEGSAYPSGLVNRHLYHLFLARDHPQSCTGLPAPVPHKRLTAPIVSASVAHATEALRPSSIQELHFTCQHTSLIPSLRTNR